MHYVSDPITTRTVHRSGGSGFCPTHNQPVTVRDGGFLTHNRPVIVTDSSVQVTDEWWSVSGETNLTGILRNAARSRQIWRDLAGFGEISLRFEGFGEIHPRSDEIPSDPARFLPYRDEKALVQLDPVFIVPKIIGFKWKRGWNLEKMGRNLEKNCQNLEKWPEFGKNGRILNGLWFGSGFMGFELKNR